MAGGARSNILLKIEHIEDSQTVERYRLVYLNRRSRGVSDFFFKIAFLI